MDQRIDLEASLRALGSADVPPGLQTAVLDRLIHERRTSPSLRWTLGLASFAVWALTVHKIVAWTAEQLSAV